MSAEVDYGAVLEDLEKKKVALENAIAGIKQILGQPQIGENTPIRSPGSTDIQSDAYSQMSMPDAIRKYLKTAKKPQSAKSITEALKSGGLTSMAQSLSNNVYAVLRRMEKETGDIVRVKKEWGLAEWYGGRKTKSNQTPNGTQENKNED